MQASVVVACSLSSCGVQAQLLWHTGLVAPRHVRSSQTRAGTHVPCIGRRILNHCATREVPEIDYHWSSFMVRSLLFSLFFSFGKCFQAFPEVARFLVSHSPSSVCFPLFTRLSLLVLGSGLVFIIQDLSWASLVINSSVVCVCVCVCVVSSPDYLQMSLLMASRWFQQAGCLTSQGLILISPTGCSPGVLGEGTLILLVMHCALTPPSICAVISVWNDLAWPISTCPSSV